MLGDFPGQIHSDKDKGRPQATCLTWGLRGLSSHACAHMHTRTLNSPVRCLQPLPPTVLSRALRSLPRLGLGQGPLRPLW